MKLKMTCSWCGGQNVRRDAWATWDDQAQAWELDQTFDNAYCDDCHGETSIEAVEDTPAHADAHLVTP